MKCPKCGYASFEYLDQCKKCGKNLESFKSEHGLYGYPPKDMMVVKFLEDKAAAEEAGETGVATAVGEEDEDLENLVSEIGGVAQGSESGEDSGTEVSVDLEEADDAEKIVADLTESASEKESGGIELTLGEAEAEEEPAEEAKEISLEIGESEEAPEEKESREIELSLDEVEVEEPKTSTPVVAEKESGEIELSLDEVEVEEPKASTTAAVGEDGSDDEINLDLDELNADLEIGDEATVDEPRQGKKGKKDDEDELNLELE